MSELTVHQPSASTDLTIADEQGSFTDMQVQALRHLGVENAGQGDLAVFFHVVKRTGLDPFARQIYMIGRKSKGEYKQTIQTGIDGYRLIGRRAADRARVSISVGQPEWAREDGQWMPLWSREWGMPLAARVTIHRDGEPFTAVAMFDEYKQTKFDGGLTAMWQQRPAGQIAKCAEALAWRLAFPQDLAGIYVEEEMGQADTERTAPVSPGRAAIASAVAPAPENVPEPNPVPVSGEEMVTSNQLKKIAAGMRDLEITERAHALAYVSKVIGRLVGSRNELTKVEAHEVIDALTFDAQAAYGDTSETTSSPDGNAES